MLLLGLTVAAAVVVARYVTRSACRQAWIAIGVVAAAAALGACWWAADLRAEAGRPVERFSHVHGLDAPAWAGGDLLVATHHGLLRSDDRGRTWTPVSLQGTADFHALTVAATDGEALFGFDATGMRLLRSLDGGRSWTHLPAEQLLAAGGVLAVEIDPHDPDRLWVGTPLGLWASDDAGVIWSERDFGGLPVTALRATADGRWFAYVPHPDLGLLVRDPSADTWRRLDIVVGDGDAVGHVAPHPTEQLTLYAGTLGMSVFATRDGGATWEAQAERGVPR